jgi:hypothetical protein
MEEIKCPVQGCNKTGGVLKELCNKAKVMEEESC